MFNRLTHLPLRLLPRGSVTRILQGKLFGKKWILGASRHAYWLGTYEKSKCRLFERTIKPGQVVFDIGAHVGYYTLLSAVLVGATGKVYAFEPLPENLAYLTRHLELNEIRNVVIVKAAVGKEPGTAMFQLGPNRSMGRLANSGAISVKVVGLDDLIANANFPLPNCLKIDVEGAEIEVLHGASQLLLTHPKIFLATHGQTIHDECVALLQKCGYTVQILEYDHVFDRGEIFAT